MMKIAFQMDPMNELNFTSDTSWQLMMEAVLRGEVYHFTPRNLSWNKGELFADVQRVTIKGSSYDLSEFKKMNLAEMDVIFIRQDPPYDMGYLTTTYLLEKISDQVLMINNPKAIRDFPEKIAVLDYLNFIPPSLITYSEDKAREFAKDYNKVILKPLYSFAGNDVFCVSANDINFSNIVSNLIEIYKAPIIVQEFLEGVKNGDKRIILVNGDPVGSYLRIPKADDIRANLACGGTAVPSELTEREIKICQAIKPRLVESGLFLVGIDVIDGYITEINVTSPTGIVAVKEFYNANVIKEIWNKIELSVNKLTISTKNN